MKTAIRFRLNGRTTALTTEDERTLLWVLRTDTGRKFEYVRFPRESFGFDGGTVFSVSADERTILFSQTDRMESDLMALEHFR